MNEATLSFRHRVQLLSSVDICESTLSHTEMAFSGCRAANFFQKLIFAFRLGITNKFVSMVVRPSLDSRPSPMDN